MRKRCVLVCFLALFISFSSIFSGVVLANAGPSSILKIEENGAKIDLDLNVLLQSMQITATYHLDRRHFDTNKMQDGLVTGFVQSLNDKQRSRLIDIAKDPKFKVTVSAKELGLSVKSEDGVVLTLDGTRLLFMLKLSVANGVIDEKTDTRRLVEYITEGMMQSLDSHSHYLNKEEGARYMGELMSENNVSSKMLGKKGSEILYVHINEYSKDTAFEFEKAIAPYKEDKNLRVLFDLRGCPGGLDTSTEAILGRIIGGGEVLLSEEDYTGKTDNVYSDKKYGDGIGRSWKIVCLVDRRTASNAEVFSAALHDILGAKLIGKQTYGKGVGGVPIPLGGDKGVCVVTYSRWYTPRGKCIEGIGIKPDIEIDDKDGQLDRAVRDLLLGK